MSPWVLDLWFVLLCNIGNIFCMTESSLHVWYTSNVLLVHRLNRRCVKWGLSLQILKFRYLSRDAGDTLEQQWPGTARQGRIWHDVWRAFNRRNYRWQLIGCESAKESSHSSHSFLIRPQILLSLPLFMPVLIFQSETHIHVQSHLFKTDEILRALA